MIFCDIMQSASGKIIKKTSYEKSSEKQKKAEKIFEVKKRVKESQKKAVRERTAKKKRGKVMLWAYK